MDKNDNHLCELELAAALVEAKTDYAEGRYTTETVAEHVQKLRDSLLRP